MKHTESKCNNNTKNLRLILTLYGFNYSRFFWENGELANKLPVFVPPVNTQAPVVLAAFNNPRRISFMK